MSVLVPPADLEQLRRQAKDLLRAAKRGEPAALARIGTVSDRLILSAAQLTLARELSFESWGWSRAGRRDEVGPERGHDQVERILAPLTPDD